MKESGFRKDGVDVHLDGNGNPRIVERFLEVEAHMRGMRLDHFIKLKIPRLSRTKIQEIIRTQLYSKSGRSFKVHTRVQSGDVYIIRRPAQPEPPCPRDFDVLYKDDQMMVILKPAGLPVHASAKFYFNTLTRVLWERFPNEDVQICHRLDRETSGVLVVARSKEAAAKLKNSFSEKTVRKKYLAIVHGIPPWKNTHEIDFPLGAVDESEIINVRMVVREGAQPSRTKATFLKSFGEFSLVECMPITGRQHQIRAHLAAAQYPIVGDKLYCHGDDAFREYCATGMTDKLLKQFILPRQALHASEITIPHPISGNPIHVRARLPADMNDFIEKAPAEQSLGVSSKFKD